MQTYKFYANNQLIEFKKLDTDEYEFSAIRDHLEYFGKSFLKGMTFITDFKNYIRSFRRDIVVEFPGAGRIMVRLPLPFSDQFELVELKEVETDEIKKLSIVMQRNNDAFAQEIKRLENRIGELEAENDRLKSEQKKYYLYGDHSFCNITYASDNSHLEQIRNVILERDFPKMSTNTLTQLQNILYVEKFLSILAQLGFKVTSNSVIILATSWRTYFFIEYMKKRKFSGVVMLSKHILPKDICVTLNDIKFGDNTEIVTLFGINVEGDHHNSIGLNRFHQILYY